MPLGLGRTSKSTVAMICAELHERFEAFCRRSLYDVNSHPLRRRSRLRRRSAHRARPVTE
jgi:hypothetical protein